MDADNIFSGLHFRSATMDIDDVTEHVKLIIKMLKAHYGKSLSEVISIFFSHKYEIRLAGETAR